MCGTLSLFQRWTHRQLQQQSKAAKTIKNSASECLAMARCARQRRLLSCTISGKLHLIWSVNNFWLVNSWLIEKNSKWMTLICSFWRVYGGEKNPNPNHELLGRILHESLIFKICFCPEPVTCTFCLPCKATQFASYFYRQTITLLTLLAVFLRDIFGKVIKVIIWCVIHFFDIIGCEGDLWQPSWPSFVYSQVSWLSPIHKFCYWVVNYSSENWQNGRSVWQKVEMII